MPNVWLPDDSSLQDSENISEEKIMIFNKNIFISSYIKEKLTYLETCLFVVENEKRKGGSCINTLRNDFNLKTTKEEKGLGKYLERKIRNKRMLILVSFIKTKIRIKIFLKFPLSISVYFINLSVSGFLFFISWSTIMTICTKRIAFHKISDSWDKR